MIAVGLTPVLAEPEAGAEQVTQALPGETVEVIEDAGEWLHVVLPGQPSSQDERGYPGWVRADAIAEALSGTESLPAAEGRATAAGLEDPAELVEEARRFLGTRYVWGGMTTDGIDCSGLTHMAARVFGLTIPRDARDQIRALTSVDVDQVEAGDLYFFAKPDGRVTHVAIATGPVAADGTRPMIHASDAPEQHVVLEETMDEHRLAALVAAARLPR